MKTPEEIYKMTLELISEGNDAVCTDCGWIGLSLFLDQPYLNCPECGSEATATGAYQVAQYALDEAAS